MCRQKHQYEQYMTSLNNTAKARIRSAAGPNSSRWLYAIPWEKQLTLSCPLFRCALQRRLGMRVNPIGDACEGCGTHLDAFGWHRTTCMRSGRVQTRHKPLIQIWRRVFREAGSKFLRGTLRGCCTELMSIGAPMTPGAWISLLGASMGYFRDLLCSWM